MDTGSKRNGKIESVNRGSERVIVTRIIGRLGKPVLLVLVLSCMLAILGLLYAFLMA